MSNDKRLLQEAIEQDKSEPLSTGEVLALLVLAIFWGVVGTLGATCFWLWREHGWTFPVTLLAGFCLCTGLVLLVGTVKALDKRGWREARAFGPSPSSDPGPGPSTPILIRAGNRTGYLDRTDEPLALPAPERRRLELTPDTLTVILREIVERHGGQWSRARIMGVKVDGQSVPRRIYEQLTDALTGAGILAERSQGGYEFSVDVKTLDDLAPFFPGLPGLTGPDGGPDGGPERGGHPEDRAIGGEVGPAERARRRWLQQKGEEQ